MKNILGELGLKLGAESFENPMDEVAAGYVATGDESETASAAILDITKESAEIDEDAEILDNTEDAVAAIDDQVEIGEIALEQNAYTPQLRMIQSIALKNALAGVSDRERAKAIVDGRLMPAHESTEGGNGGKLAVENMKETAGALYSSAIAQFKAIIEKIINFLKTSFDGAHKLQKRANDLKASASKAQPGKVKVTAAGTIKVGDKLGQDAVDGYKIVAKAVSDTFSESRMNFGNLAVEAGDSDALVVDFSGGEVPADLKSTAAEGATVTCSGEASGGVVFAAIKGGNGSHNVIHKTAAKGNPEESDALSSAQITSTLGDVVSVCADIIKGKALASKLQAAVKSFEKDFGKGGAKEGEGQDKDSRANVTAALTAARRAGMFRKDLVTLALAAGNGMCNYVEASTKAPKAAKEEGANKE